MLVGKQYNQIHPLFGVGQKLALILGFLTNNYIYFFNVAVNMLRFGHFTSPLDPWPLGVRSEDVIVSPANSDTSRNAD